MKYLSFELTMPNVGSWNGKWSGADRKYFIIKKISDRFFKNDIKKLFVDELCLGTGRNFHYNFGDGWGANVRLELIDALEAKHRTKLSNGFVGYDWMVDSIIRRGKITTEE
jgi:hypothetical protein